MVLMELYVSPECPKCQKLLRVLNRYGFLFADVPKKILMDMNPTRYYEIVNPQMKQVIPVKISGTGTYHTKELERSLRRISQPLAEYIGTGVPQIVLKKMTSKGLVKIAILGGIKEGREEEFVYRLRSLIELMKKI